MFKTTYIGDIHGRNIWKQIVQKEADSDMFVFLGDYFDSYYIPYIEQANNFVEICQYKRDNYDKVILLIGNHDYYPGIEDKNVGGYQIKTAFLIEELVRNNKDILQMAYLHNEILCTHAGVTHRFLEETGWDKIQPIDEYLNELLKYKPGNFLFKPSIKGRLSDPYGNNAWQSPVWVRPEALMKNSDEKIAKIQIVGHTGDMKKIHYKYSDNKQYFFIDKLEEGIYLVNKDDKFEIKNIYEQEK